MNIQKIISFDVGIKNMAFCIFSVTGDKEVPFHILDWNILNLMEREPAPTNTCICQVLQKKKPCTKMAKYRTNVAPDVIPNANTHPISSVGTEGNKDMDRIHYFCENHAKKNTRFLLPSARFSSSQLKRMSIEELNQELQKYSQPCCTTKKSAIENLETYIAKNTLISLTEKKKSANDLDLVTLGQHMMEALDANPHIHGITHVLIENQISPIANRMKTVQGMLAQYFIMRVPGCRIEFVSSANKLKPFLTKKETEEKAGEYKQHKRDGVYYCTQVVQHHTYISCWHPHLEASKKKDDLADAFLQGLWYLANNKIIRVAENLKINSI